MARTSFLALLFVLKSYQWQGIGCMYDATSFRISVSVCSMLCIVCPFPVSTLPELTPSAVLSACPGDKVVINCYESETTVNTRISLRWEITPGPMNRSTSKIEVSLNNDTNNGNRREGGLEFYAEWTSYFPLSAILTTTAHSALDGATVTCAAGGSASSNPLIIRVTHGQIGNQ